MTLYNPAEWHDLFVMVGGAGAALAGLIFVAVSLNHEQILRNPAHAGLSGGALSTLVSLVVLCIAVLIPQQPRPLFGAEVIAIGVALAAAQIVIATTNVGFRRTLSWVLRLLVFAGVVSIPLIVGGVSLMAGVGGGMAWLAAECALGIILAAQNGWILLIEVRRRPHVVPDGRPQE